MTLATLYVGLNNENQLFKDPAQVSNKLYSHLGTLSTAVFMGSGSGWDALFRCGWAQHRQTGVFWLGRYHPIDLFRVYDFFYTCTDEVHFGENKTYSASVICPIIKFVGGHSATTYCLPYS